ncbi:MAG: hypothetical protein H7843_07930 [Nitrospirota bacterium]
MRVWLSVLIVVLLAVSTVLSSSTGVTGYSVTIFVLMVIFGVMIAAFLFIAKKVNAKACKEPLEKLAKGLGAAPRQGFFVTESIITGKYNDYGYYCRYVAPTGGKPHGKEKTPPQFIIRLMAQTAVRLCMEIQECNDSACKAVNISNKLRTGDDEFDTRFKLMGQDSEVNRAVLSNSQFRGLIKRLFSYGRANAGNPESVPLFEIGDLSFGSKYIETTIYGLELKDITPKIVHDTLDCVIEMLAD